MNRILKSTPVLLVETIEPSLPLWEALAFSRTVEVPRGDTLAFVILVSGNVEIMYQTVASMREDSPAHGARFRDDKTFLFVEVDDIDAIEKTVAHFETVMPRRQTFYGSTEIGIREPGGHFVTFAQMKR